MKKIKIKYVGFWEDFNRERYFITRVLRKHFDVEICDDPDYIISSIFEDYHAYIYYPQIRILCSGENYLPDLNLVDYAITPYPISLYDRCFHLPEGLREFDRNEYLTKKSKGEVKFDETILSTKTVFANFCTHHQSEFNIREDFFNELCKYKKVDSIGTYLNNTGVFVKLYDSKDEYQKKCKFSLCFESTSHDGFNTEKITDAFYNDTIPVYHGDPHIGDIYNKKAFIDVSDYNSFEEAIEKIKQIDNDDKLYLDMLNEPVFNDPDYAIKLEKDLEEFVVNLFNQPIEKAKRRSEVYSVKNYEDYIKELKNNNSGLAKTKTFFKNRNN